MKIKFIVFLILMALFVAIDAASTARGQRPKPPKPPPVSVTISDPTPDVGQIVVLAVDNSNDPNPKWVLGKKQFRYGRSITLSWSSAGQYLVTVIAKDLRGKPRRSSIQVTVTAQPPIINSVEIPAQSPSLDPVVLTAQATDPGGQPVSYFWDFGDGQVSTEQNPTHTYSRPGSYTVRLTVTDQSGVSVSHESPITILNRVPIALFSSSTPGWWVQTTITFDGRASHDLDGRIVNCRWEMGDGTIYTGPYPDQAALTYQYRRQDRYTVTFTVTDDLGSQESRSETIVIGNRNPIAKITASTTTIVAGKTITFDGTASTDPDNDNLTYAWSFGDNTTGAGAIVEHLYATAGTYTPALTVTDDWSATATASITITVTPPPPPPRWPPQNPPGGTKITLTGQPTRPPIDVVTIRTNDNSIGDFVQIDDADIVWTMTPLSSFLLPSGQSNGYWPNISAHSRFTIDPRDQSFWLALGAVELGGPVYILHYSRSLKLLSQTPVGFWGIVLCGIDTLGYLYFDTVDHQGKQVVRALDTRTTKLLENEAGQPISWPQPYGQPHDVLIHDGINLIMLFANIGKIIHFNRYTGDIIHSIAIAHHKYHDFAIGPNNEILLLSPGYRTLTMLDPSHNDDSQPIDVEKLTLKERELPTNLYQKNGIRVVTVDGREEIGYFLVVKHY